MCGRNSGTPHALGIHCEWPRNLTGLLVCILIIVKRHAYLNCLNKEIHEEVLGSEIEAVDQTALFHKTVWLKKPREYKTGVYMLFALMH